MRITALTVAVGAVGILSFPALGTIGNPEFRDRSNTRIYSGSAISAVPLDASAAERGGGLGDVYSNLDPGPNGYVAFPAATGYAGFDDYDSVKDADILLGEFGFVGGVTTAGGIAFFSFYDASSNFVDSFGVALTNAGNFIYTITIGSPFLVPDNGIVQMFVDSGTTGQWFLGDAGPTIGTEDNMFGSVADGTFSHNFRLHDVPAPGALALLGIAGVMGSRRRRR